MPARFEFTLAEGEADDAALRALFAGIPMEGGMRIAFEREPSFFDALRVQGDRVQVGVCRERATNTIIGSGTRSIATCYLDGAPAPVGYLGDLRLAPQYRGGTLVARGYRFFRALDADGAAKAYYTAIFSDNARAQSTLASGRAGIPHYHPLGRFLCPGLLPARHPVSPGVERAGPAQLPEIVAFLNARNASRQFAPVHHLADFAPGGRWRGFRVEDFFVLRRGGTVRAVAGLWDQRAFKQTRVLGYSGRGRLLRAASAAFSWLGAPRLPRAGSHLASGYAAFLASHDAGSLAAVLAAALGEARRRGWLYCLAGLHEDDPLAPALHGFPNVDFSGELFHVSPPHEASGISLLNQRIPYVEAATL
ncbi:hypothetical protein BH23VER1_BH23VER1_23040 [soil metagenome]